jgi:hypothetical protein
MHVIVMHLILTFFVMGLTLVLIFGVLVALFGGMIALWSMSRARLECLVTAIRRSLVLLFLLVLVIVVKMIAVVAILPLVVMTIIHLALPAVATVTPVTLLHDMADLLVVLPPEHLTHLTLHAKLDLTLAFLHKGAICHLHVKNISKFCDRLKHVVTKTSPTLNILCAILRVKGHVEPLEL